MLPYPSTSTTPIDSSKNDTPSNLNKTNEKMKNSPEPHKDSSQTIQNPNLSIPKYFSFISQEKSELKDSLVYTESQRNMGSFINLGTNWAKIKDQIVE